MSVVERSKAFLCDEHGEWDDRGEALIRELVAEVARLVKLNSMMLHHEGDAEAICNSYATENAQFHAKIERMREVLEWIAEGKALTIHRFAKAAVQRARDALKEH